MTRRWELTDRQRLLLILAVAAAIFLGAMALGGQSAWLLLTAVGVPAITIVGVLMLAVRRAAQRHEVATARVLSVSAATPGSIIGRCDIRLAVSVPGRGRVEVKLREHDLPVTKWPQPGQTLPVDVTGGNPLRHLRIRWDLVDQGYVRAPDPTPPRSYTSPTPARHSPPVDAEVIEDVTPPRPRRDTPVHEPAPTARLLHETFTDPDEPMLRATDDATVRTQPHPSEDLTAPPEESAEPVRHPPQPPPPPPSGNGHDPDGYDPGDFEPARLEPVTDPPTPADHEQFETISFPDFDPAEVDRRDFGEEAPTTPFDEDEEYGVGPAAATGATAAIPQPRPAEQERGVDSDAEGSDAAPVPAGVSAVLAVDDLERSLRFYGETLGFTIAYATSTSAMVESGRTRIVLRQDSTPGSQRSDQLQLQVADVEARYRDLQSRGVEFPEPPRALSSGDDLELWLARLRDPDGHEIELIEWRQRG